MPSSNPPAPTGAPPGRWVSAEYLGQYLSRTEVAAFQRHERLDLYWLPDARAEHLTRPIHSKEAS